MSGNLEVSNRLGTLIESLREHDEKYLANNQKAEENLFSELDYIFEKDQSSQTAQSQHEVVLEQFDDLDDPTKQSKVEYKRVCIKTTARTSFVVIG